MRRGRHKKVRYIQNLPVIKQFSPRGKPGRPDDIHLTVDEFEAIKLADYQGYDQTEGAGFMRISRPSFGRILRKARQVLADALVNGKIIRISIGDVQVGVRRVDLPGKKEPGSQARFAERKVRNNILKYGVNNA